MKPKWNLKELRDHIRSTRSNSDDLLEIVHSIDRYIRIFLFHLEGARDAMNKVIDAENPCARESFEFVLGVSERQDEFDFAKVASEAHILGAVHSARASFDVFAFLVNGLFLGGSIPESKCDIKIATKALQQSSLKTELEALTDSYWFSYVSAFINTAKHRMLVRHSFHVGIEEPYTGVRIGAFEYNGQKYPSYKVKELLEGVLEVKNKIVDCGKLLNDQLVTDGV